MTASHLLDRLSELLGVQTRYTDAWEQPREAPESTRLALLAAMGWPADSDEAAARSIEQLERDLIGSPLAPVIIVYDDEAQVQVPVTVPAGARGRLTWILELENGARLRGAVAVETLPLRGEPTIGDMRHEQRTLDISGPIPPGYHRLIIRIAQRPRTITARAPFICAPRCCYRPASLKDDGRRWGISIQLYNVRSRRNWGIGDYTDLTELLRHAARQGAAVIGINPLHAMFPNVPQHASPYSPSSRRFLNTRYIDVEAIPDFADSEPARRLVRSHAFQQRLEKLRASEYVDYAGVVGCKLEVLDILYRTFRERSLHLAEHPRAQAFRRFQADGGRGLRHFAIYQVIAERAAREGWGFGWQNWPEELRDPNSDAVQAIVRKSEERVEFYEYLQWQAELQMQRAKRTGERLGMSIGIYTDLAVGGDGGGFDVWDCPDVIINGARTGAPPDRWNMKGQDWGLPPFHPLKLRQQGYRLFADLLRANMRRGGALRIDHVIGLMRLYWIPAGAPATDGAYVVYPLNELLAVLALESQRARCLVIGEDLGTVPRGLSETLMRAGLLSYRVFYFESQADGTPRPPEAYPKEALVTVATHDLPTLPAYWGAKDIELKDRLDLWPTPEHRSGDVDLRARSRPAIEHLLTAQDLADRPRIDGAPVSGVYELLSRTPSRLLMVQLEDVLGQVEQVNVPGTVDEYPNWSRKLSATIDDIFARDDFQALTRHLSSERGDRPRLKHTHDRAAATVVPLATYRLQLNDTFTFDDAARVAPYLDALGVSHLYASPWLKARAGSTHGYDITDHNAFNPELGGEPAYVNLAAILADLKIEQILDFVPNHMGIGRNDNAWWLDVLEWGRESPYAAYFDIDWHSGDERLRNKVLLPFLGDQYGRELESGKLVPTFDAATGSFSVLYYEHRFPLSPRDYGPIIRRAISGAAAHDDPALLEAIEKMAIAFESLRDEDTPRRAAIALKGRLAEIAIEVARAATLLAHGAEALSGVPEDANRFQGLHDLLERQNYRLAYWGVASDEVNYRRFFNITDLAGIRIENPELFEAAHRLVRRLIADGTLKGLRLDHIDGLFDPAAYCAQLRALAADATGREDALYIVVEKILARHERLRDWPIDGTTGYDYLAQANGIFVDARNETAMTRAYERFVGREIIFDEALHQAKLFVMESILGGELNSLARELDRLSEEHWASRDYTLEGLRAALMQVVAYFPVYRTYVDPNGTSTEDRRDIGWAIARARKNWRGSGKEIFDFIESALTADLGRAPNSGYDAEHVVRFAQRVQQFTGPVMAKGLEDTTFYRYNRLISLCEVGADPRQFGQTLTAFHHQNQERAARWPHNMLASATHDTKRGEDARARINVLSEIPGEWNRRVARWASLNRRRKQEVDGQPAPGRNDEYLLYQSLIGGWPLGLDPELASADVMKAFVTRVQACMLKAVREAKVHSSWNNPNAEYEGALERFIAQLLDRSRGRPFLRDFIPFQARIAALGMLNGLSQTTLKLTCPGVPDIYQGTELWDFSFVDPDNRRPVDFGERVALLGRLSAMPGGDQDRGDAVAALRESWQDGAIKLLLIRELIGVRNRLPSVFAHGGYRPLEVYGPQNERVAAFARSHEGVTVIVAVGRLFAEITEPGAGLPAPGTWAGTSVTMPEVLGGVFRDIFTGISFDAAKGFACEGLFATLPVAVLESVD
jgi:(1->4)-alpha-D-glucan 1-alpha-D-glucosylmutase